MSSRALRKAQKEKEEQELLRKLQQEAEELEEEGEDDAPAQPAKKSAFELLNEQEDDDDDDDDDDETGGAAIDQDDEDDAAAPAESSIASAPKSSNKKKKKKKKKTKAVKDTPTTAEPQEDLDEIDRALKQLSTTNNASQQGATAGGVDTSINETCRLLAIDTSHLHAQNEMRRLFGRAALDQQDADDAPQQGNIGGNRRQQRRVQQVGLAQALRGQGGAGGRSGGLSVIALRRNIFVQGKEEWPVATGGGLGMDVEEKRADGTVLYRFVHNRAYQDVQSQFESCVESMDPNRLVVLLQHNPYHISTLLQVSEIAKQERDHATSGDLLERALFSLGRAVHSTFAKNLAEGKARLDFRRPENREFWLASWRYMQNLSMRATWRTVYEWAKLLLSLSPDDDPYALWLVLDQYALRSKQDLDYLNISRNATFKAVHQSMPNVQLSQGLAEYRSGNKSKGQQALFTAIGRFPWVVARLMQELTIDPPPAIWGKEPRTEKEKMYTELYAIRGKDLWNTPETSALLTEVASALQPDMPTAEPDMSAITQTEARHVLLSDTPALIALLPRNLSAQMTSVSDPLPPSDNTPSYTTSTTQTQSAYPSRSSIPLGTPAENQRELDGLRNFFSNVFPWFRPTAQPVAHVDGGDDDAAAGGVPPERPSEEAIARSIREAGIDHETMVERMQRMMLLEAQMVGGSEQVGDGGPAHGTEDVEGSGRRARVEEAPEEE